MKFLILNGPNINMLGIREPEIYGEETYDALVEKVKEHAEEIGVEVEFFQSNHEGALIDEIQRAYFSQVDGIVFNPAGYTHTSIALADAVKAVSIPTGEVHISFVSERETYRQISFVRAVAIDTVEGQGLNGYLIAMDALKNHLINNEG